jgi:large subunit ribosomal protein L3
MKFILGKKLEMSQMFDEKKDIVPVTLIEAGPCFITQIKTKDKDNYESIQIGFEKLKDKKITKNKKSKPYRYLREFDGDASKYKAGDKIDASIFAENEKVIIVGTSKGKGFAGAVKRWGFHGRNASHGVKHEERTIGSIGRRFPQRVIKGKKMPGRMGSDRTTVKGLKIVKIDVENNLIAIKGAIPGRKGTLLEIKA